MLYLLSQAQLLQPCTQLQSQRPGSHTHTLGRFYPNSSSGQSTVKVCWCRGRCPTGGRGTPSALPAQLKAPALRGIYLFSQKGSKQLAEVHNLLPYSQPREGCVCEALHHQQRKQLSSREGCCLLRSGPTQSGATNPCRLPATC